MKYKIGTLLRHRTDGDTQKIIKIDRLHKVYTVETISPGNGFEIGYVIMYNQHFIEHPEIWEIIKSVERKEHLPEWF